MSIPIIVVDDDSVDRYLVKRRLAKNNAFCELIEIPSGDIYLDQYECLSGSSEEKPMLVLMDINMPGRDGFQTIEEARKRRAEGRESREFYVIHTSSENELDRKRANDLDIVKGYIRKPLDKKGIETIINIYQLQLDQ